jgi:site-specific DNA recombinase
VKKAATKPTETLTAVVRGSDPLDEVDLLNQQRVKRAVVYLRVSTPSQVNTDYNPEGISLPAQRERCEQKCTELGADIVREFVEPGRTATSIEKRPVFQEMIAWVKAQADIDYVVVYHFNRIFRNSVDSGLTKRELAKVGTRVVSTVIDLGESLEGDMVETILSAVDQYQSAFSGADISFKMGTKARNGGTLGRAPLGYINQRDTSDGRNIGVVVFDATRAPLLKLAFELYATGDWSIESLQDELYERGLRSRPGRFPAGEVSTSKLASMLRDPYYCGYLRYKGELIKGRHEALVTQELFDQVQQVMDHRSGSGQRQRRHNHYLKGALWCGQCHDQGVESRMILQWASGNGGRYLYFFCRRKQSHECDSRYLEGDGIEEGVERLYMSLQFDPELAKRLRIAMKHALAEREEATVLVAKQLKSELARLDKQEENLIELAADGGLAVAKVRNRLGLVQRQRDTLTDRLNSQDEHLEVGIRLIEGALQLLSDPAGLYGSMALEDRRQMNGVVFEKIYAYDWSRISGVYKQPFEDLLGAQAAVRKWTYERQAAPTLDLVIEANTKSLAQPLAAVLVGHGSNKAIMVEETGLEPATCWLQTNCSSS